MSGSNNEITNSAAPASGAEPSMEEILASIRRILKEDQETPASPSEAKAAEDVLVLDPSMMVKPPPEPLGQTAPLTPVRPVETIAAESNMAAEPPPHLASELAAPDFPAEEIGTVELAVPEQENKMENSIASVPGQEDGPGGQMAYPAPDEGENVQPPPGIMSDAAASAAANSIGALIQSISTERSVAIGRPGLTLEDLVREELRPLLKAWLDSNLPALVERIVRAEIQRVVERGVP